MNSRVEQIGDNSSRSSNSAKNVDFESESSQALDHRKQLEELTEKLKEELNSLKVREKSIIESVINVLCLLNFCDVL